MNHAVCVSISISDRGIVCNQSSHFRVTVSLHDAAVAKRTSERCKANHIIIIT